MTYEEFKKELRSFWPKISCKVLKELHKMEYPEQYTLADTNVSQQIKEEGINPMFDTNETCNVPWVKKTRILAPMANAQVIGSVPVEATQRDYAIERIKVIGEKHAQALRVQFNMDSEETPKTARDLIAAIKEDAFRLDEKLLAKNEESLQYFSPFYGIDWGKNAPDTKGYEAAKEVLKTAAQKALDGATLKPLDQLEAVIDDFEAWEL